MNMNIKKIVFAALVGGLYAALTLVLAPLSYGIVQCRISEALTVLPFFSSFSVIGLGVGCLVANLLSPIGIPDMIFGSLATLAAAYITYKIGKSNMKFKRILAPLPAVIINGVVVGILINIYSPFNLLNYLIAMGSVALGELIPCYVIGLPLITLIEKNKRLKEYLIF